MQLLLVANNTTTIGVDSQIDSSFTVVLFKIFTNAAFYYLSPFIPFGIVFNLLILVAFTRKTQEALKTAQIYYLVMAWGELGTVIFKDLWFFDLGIGIPEVFHANPIGVLNIHAVSNAFLCPFVWFIWYAHETTSNIAFVALDFERVFAIYFPLKTYSWFTSKTAVVTMIIVIVFSTLASGTIFGFSKFQEVSLMPFGTFCFFASNLGAWSFVPILVFLSNYILPAFLPIISSVLLSIKIVRQKRFRLSLTALTASSSEEGYVTFVKFQNNLPLREISV